jgi:cupin fold WbuC family metalloprotein
MMNDKQIFSGFLSQEGSRSISYRSSRNISCVDDRMIDQLVEMALTDDVNARLCLNSSVEDFVHSMIIVELENRFPLPKSNVGKDQIFHIIRGRMGILTFDSLGNITEKIVLEETGNCKVFFVGAGTYHCNVPLGRYAVHHEVRTGPFTNTNDKLTLDRFKSVDSFESRLQLRQFFEQS